MTKQEKREEKHMLYVYRSAKASATTGQEDSISTRRV